MTEIEKRDSGLLYDANNDPQIIKEINSCSDICFAFNKIKPSNRKKQQKILKKIFKTTGKNICINAPLWVDYGYKTEIGNNFFANRNCQIQDGGGVIFGNNIFIGPNCTFTTAEHALDVEQRNKGLEVALSITIGNNVWIGAGCIILPGVTIGDNSVIGAGSIVKNDIPSNVVAVGIPCKVLRGITEKDKEKYKK